MLLVPLGKVEGGDAYLRTRAFAALTGSAAFIYSRKVLASLETLL